MNGHWVSQTRKLNHHYQSALPSILRAYLSVHNNNQMSNNSFYFTPHGLDVTIPGVGNRQFVRYDLIDYTEDDYIPISCIPEMLVIADGVGFNTLNLENESFTNNKNADIIMRRETVTFTSKFDGSSMTMPLIVFLCKLTHFGLYTDSSGNVWFDGTLLSGLIITFPGIDTKIAEVGRKFNLRVRAKYYYHTAMDSSNYDLSAGLAPKNLNNLKNGNMNYIRTLEIDKSEWERSQPRPWIADKYYGLSFSLMSNDPYTSVSPNMENIHRGNYLIMFNGYETGLYYRNKSGSYEVQTYLVPSVIDTRNDSHESYLDNTDITDIQCYSANGSLLCVPVGATEAGYGGVFSKVEGDDWKIMLSAYTWLLPGTIYLISYGAPDDGSGSSLSLPFINDIWENNFDSNV